MSSGDTSLDAADEALADAAEADADALAAEADAEAALADADDASADALEADSLAAEALPDADELAALEEDDPPQAASPRQHAHIIAAANIAKHFFISNSFPSFLSYSHGTIPYARNCTLSAISISRPHVPIREADAFERPGGYAASSFAKVNILNIT